MKYTLWYSCYIDLLRADGVAATFIEHDNQIHCSYQFETETTINKLNLIATVKGLKDIPKSAEIDVFGNSKYIYEVLQRIKGWDENDEIDIKTHSGLLRQLWQSMTEKGRMQSSYFTSRRSDPMLWATSKAAGWCYRKCQEYAIEYREYPIHRSWGFQPWDKETFLTQRFANPLTDMAMEKLILKEKAKLVTVNEPEPGLAKIFTLPGQSIRRK